MRMFRSTKKDEAATAMSDRAWYGPTRATMTLLGVAVAGFLVWLATQVNSRATGGYWAAYGIVAGAGIVLALSQLLGGWTKFGLPRLSGSVLLFAFLPTLIVVGWIAVFHQPSGGWFRNHAIAWSGDLGIDGFVRDMGELLSVLALGLGVVFGYCFDTTGPRQVALAKRDAAVTEPTPVAVDRAATDAPVTAEWGTVNDGEPAATAARKTPEE
jgi:hypothetical protein